MEKTGQSSDQLRNLVREFYAKSEHTDALGHVEIAALDDNGEWTARVEPDLALIADRRAFVFAVATLKHRYFLLTG